jgi:Flp pilus assembly protein TadG
MGGRRRIRDWGWFVMAFRLFERLRHRIASVLGDRRGATAIMFAFMVVPIFASVGLAITIWWN